MLPREFFMSKHANSEASQAFQSGQPSSAGHAVREAMHQGGRIRFAYSRIVGIPEMPPCDPTASQREAMLFETVEGLQGSKTAGAVTSSTTKRYPCTVTDRITGQPIDVMVKLVTNVVHVIAYGMRFTFTKTNRGKTVLDSRNGKRVRLEFARAELRRILGDSEGLAKYAALIKNEQTEQTKLRCAACGLSSLASYG